MSVRIKVEAVKSRSEFIEFIRARNLDFVGMSVSGCRKKHLVGCLQFIGTHN